MARITNGEQIALALQARLNRLKKQNKASKNEPQNSTDTVVLSEGNPLVDMATSDLNEEGLTRQIVGHLLEEEFGAEFALDYRFSIVVNRVSEMLQNNEVGAQILSATIEELKNSVK